VTAVQNGSWSNNKKDPIRRHYREFSKLINNIPFDKREGNTEGDRRTEW